MKLVLLRHPPAEVRDGLCYGSSDPPPAPGWERWVEDVCRIVETLPQPVALRSSPLERCRRPASALGGDVVLDARLREMDFGDWEGRRWRDIPRADIERWNADLANVAPPGGERLAEVHARALSFMQASAEVNAQTVLAVSHGGPIRCMLAEVLAAPLAHLFRLRVDPGSLSVVTLDGDAAIIEMMNLTIGK
ncbi:MAG: histidine phosphatase family protein [Gammaproteobacteria bacterium]|nr:histidine phosphatase family protein [Gammaproteobacteria bacterium]